MGSPAKDSMKPPSQSKKFAFPLVLALCLYGCLELFSCAALKALPETEPEFRLSKAQRDAIPRLIAGRASIIFDRETGWMHSDPLHVRSTRTITLSPGPDRIRIAFFGDSLVHGDEVGPEDAFPELINRYDRRIDSLNCGVSRFGLDQAYLAYMKHGRPLSPSIVVICLMSENMLRNLNVFRPFFSEHDVPPLTKPRFRLHEGQLVLEPNPFQEVNDYRRLLSDERATLLNLGRGDFFFSNYTWASSSWEATPFLRLVQRLFFASKRKNHLKLVLARQQYFDSSEAVELTTRILQQFYEDVRKHRSEPVIFMLPRYQDVLRHLSKDTTDYEPVLRRLRAENYNVVDGMGAFSSLAPRDFERLRTRYFTKAGHYSPETNGRIARFFYETFLEQRLQGSYKPK